MGGMIANPPNRVYAPAAQTTSFSHHSLLLLFQTRVVAIFHAFTTMTLAYRLSFLCRPLEIGGVNTPGQDIVVNVAGGFFLYDLISWIIYGYVIAKYVGREGGREGGRGWLGSYSFSATHPLVTAHPSRFPSLPPSLPPLTFQI